MNRTKIEYLNYTWNPAVGCYGFGCTVTHKCWARLQAKRQKNKCKKCYTFEPHIHCERLDYPLHVKKSSRVGVCFMGDLFAQQKVNIFTIYQTMRKAYWHTFLVLTKAVYGLNLLYDELKKAKLIRPNIWHGVTITKQQEDWRLQALSYFNCGKRFVSFEPLYEPISLGWSEWHCLDWIIIGAERTGKHTTFMPKKEWVNLLIEQARGYNKPIFLKDNLQWPEKIRELPC